MKPKKLTEVESMRFNIFNVLKELREKEQEVLKLRQFNIELQEAAVKHKINLDRERLIKDKSNFIANDSKDKKDKEQFIIDIKKRLSIDNDFSYNKDTLEIIETEKNLKIN